MALQQYNCIIHNGENYAAADDDSHHKIVYQ